MRALIVYCHPDPGSYTAAVRDTVIERLKAAEAEVRVIDLYRRDFAPALTRAEWQGYLDSPTNCDPVAGDVANVRWCDTLIFVYPTWWYGLPAMLKGWLDRVLLPDVAFLMPDSDHAGIRPALRHVTRLAVLTTCGASWGVTWFVGSPGRRTLLRGVGMLCARPLTRLFLAHYRMDHSTPETRARHLSRVAARMDRFVGRRAAARQGAVA
jgi:putative NADPH-quinone reductase